jgi:hypothetical protein
LFYSMMRFITSFLSVAIIVDFSRLMSKRDILFSPPFLIGEPVLFCV